MRPDNYRKQWPRKNLGAFIDFLEERYPDGLSLQKLSEDIGVTVGALSNMFNRDNVKLSRIEEIADKYGYTLKLYFPSRNFADGEKPEPFIKEYHNTGNLYGMYKYIRDSGYSIEFVSEQMDVSNSVVKHALEKGDMQISMLNRFLEACGICCIWKFEKKTN
jgi:lambda repressor-like predicted transcriptional regulator